MKYLEQYFSKRRYRFAIAFLATLTFYVAILPFNEHLAFTTPYTDRHAELLALTLKGFGFPIFFSLFYFIANFIYQLRLGDPFYRAWLKHAVIYLGIMGIFMLILYPGHWVGDEFDILESVRQYSLYSWQNYLTNIFYTFSLYLMPTGVGIVIVQLGILSFITGYVLTLSKKLFAKKYTHYYLYIPFLFFPVILNNFYPLRLTLYSYLLLLLFASLFLLYKKQLNPKSPHILFLQMSVLVAIVCFWRTEGIIYLSLLPIFAYKLGLLRKSTLKEWQTQLTYVVTLVFIFIAFLIVSTTTSDKYQITATLNPLSTMIQGNLHGKNIDKDLDAIDKVVDLSIVKKYPSATEIPSFWHGAVRDDYYDHLNGYNSHVYKIILENPGLFVKNRIDTFMATNSFGGYPSLGLSQFYNPDPAIVDKVQHFYEVNKVSHPLNLHLKLAATKALLMVDREYHPGLLAKLVWSIIPTVLALLVLGFVSIRKRQWLLLYMHSLLLVHAVLIFVTAPASYFMYYFPVYLTGNFLIAITLLGSIEKNRAYSRWMRSFFRGIVSKRPIVFLLVGALNTTLDFLFYTFLVHVVFQSPNMIGIVGVVSGTFALACAYTSHRLITWRDKRATKTTLIKFFITTGLGLWVIRPILLAWFITFTPLYLKVQSMLAHRLGVSIDEYTIASTCAFLGMVVIVMIYNYVTYARFVFTHSR